MSQWGVQLVIGRLLTDDHFRRRFERERQEFLDGLRQRGLDLTDGEVVALVDADAQMWSAMAARIDQRLHLVRRRRSGVGRRLPRRFTAREHEVLRSVCDGMTNKQIAAALGVSEAAVKATLQQLFRKTQVRSRAQLVRAVVEGALGAAPERP